MIPKENTTADDHAKSFRASSSSAKTWSRLNDPRIVRVSRAFGGKDRHSKVYTVRGLRDRRVRLSVPTAIQLYDLQERLGLNQPSKVIDWLLDAAKRDIDELPPLQIPPGSLCHHNLQQMLSTNNSHEFRSSHEKQAVLKISGGLNWFNDQLKHPRSNPIWGLSKNVSGETAIEKDENSARIGDERQFSLETQGAYVSANNFFPRSNSSSLLNSHVMPYNSFVKWDPSNLTLSHPPRNHSLSTQPEDLHSFNLVQLPPTLSVPSGSQQVLVYQPGTAQTYFPSQISAMNTEFILKHQNFQSLQFSNPSLTSPVRPLTFGMTANLLQSQNNARNERNKDNEFHLE